MTQLFSSLSRLLESAGILAGIASFVWGMLSILLSPCHLTSIPLIIGFISDRNITVRKSLIISLLFSLGILVTIAIIGLITGLMGRIIGDTGIWGNIVVAVIFFIMGLYFIGVIHLDFLTNLLAAPQFSRKNYFTAFLLGLVFGIGLGPCTFAFLAPVLGVAFRISGTNFIGAFLLLLLFGLGHCLVIVIFAMLMKLAEKYIRWAQSSRFLDVVKKICGVLLMAGSVYFVVNIFLK